jgi:O-antigen/teichoic acid export membrane protein
MIKSTINRLRNSELLRNSIWMFLGQGLQIVIQAVYFVLIARSLGSQGYGAFVAVGALVGILAPFASFGSGNLLIKNVARNADSFGRYWGNALLLTLISGTVLLFAVLGISQFVFPAEIPFSLVLVVAVADLLFARVIDISGQAFLAFQRLDRTALVQVMPNIFRLSAIAGLSTCVQSPTPLQWGYLYLITTVISMLIGMWLVHKELGLPILTLTAIKAEMTEGFYFSVSLSAQGVYNDIDKTMLTRYSSLDAVGIYSAAYRIIDVSFVPIRSLLYAAYARFFQHGASGVRGSLGFAKRIFPFAAGYGLIGGILIIIAAPLLPFILGAEYSNAADALRWLASLPFLKAVHYFASDTLTGAGFQGLRSSIQVAVAIFNIAINLWLIPIYSWLGAAWASVASDGLLAILVCLALIYIYRQEKLSEKLDRLA